MTENMDFPSVFDCTGREFGFEEQILLHQVLESGSLSGDRGCCMVEKFENEFASRWGLKYGIALNSGTAALHCCLASLGLAEGDQVITSALTDMGAITPILFQRATPVFADIELNTLNISKDTVEKKITDSTRAIIVTHLFGNPAEIEDIVELANKRGIAIIEDCAQAYLAMRNNRLVGTFGDFAFFSLHQTKHITCGEGGIALTNSEKWAQRIRCFANRGLAYHKSQRQYLFPGLSYHMNELSAAVALAQLQKLDKIVDCRRKVARNLSEKIRGIPGLSPPDVIPGSKHSYWAYPIILDIDALQLTVGPFCDYLRSMGIPTLPSYIGQPLFEAPFTKEALRHDPLLKNDYGEQELSQNALEGAFPNLMEIMPRLVFIPWNERYEEKHVDALFAALNAAVDHALIIRAHTLFFFLFASESKATDRKKPQSERELDDISEIVEVVRQLLSINPREGLVERLLRLCGSNNTEFNINVEAINLVNKIAKGLGSGLSTPSSSEILELLNRYRLKMRELIPLY